MESIVKSIKKHFSHYTLGIISLVVQLRRLYSLKCDSNNFTKESAEHQPQNPMEPVPRKDFHGTHMIKLDRGKGLNYFSSTSESI